jgi:hypothetical protein
MYVFSCSTLISKIVAKTFAFLKINYFYIFWKVIFSPFIFMFCAFVLYLHEFLNVVFWLNRSFMPLRVYLFVYNHKLT